MIDVLELVGRDRPLFAADIARHEAELAAVVMRSSFLILGGAGSIGRAVVREIFKRDPRRLHVIDINENNLVELVRDLRSTLGYGSGEFATVAIDAGSHECDALFHHTGGYDYVLNLSALKHVRSERDPFTLMRMIEVNVLNTLRTCRLANAHGARGYFCVSTDKAANPASLMGATKRIMELALHEEARDVPVAMARMANVAFSDGSLLHGFEQRWAKQQPLSASRDVRRFFLTSQEAGELCLIAALMAGDGEIFLPDLDPSAHLAGFSEIAQRYLAWRGYVAQPCASEQEARERAAELIASGRWPCYFFESDTSGEKLVEELFTEHEAPDFSRFDAIGVIAREQGAKSCRIGAFLEDVARIRNCPVWSKTDIADAVSKVIPEFRHVETGRNLDDRM